MRDDLFKETKSILKEKNLVHCKTLKELKEKFKGGQNILLSCGIGEIIPEEILTHCALAINIHAASPDYPGRDIHHYASYNGVTVYGATAHLMTKKVDEGSIIDVELRDVDPLSTGIALQKIAIECCLTLLRRVLKNVFIDQKEITFLPIQWGAIKRKRSDLEKICRISPQDSQKEVDRKYRAFQKDNTYSNLYIDLYGYRFRFEKNLNEEKSD